MNSWFFQLEIQFYELIEYELACILFFDVTFEIFIMNFRNIILLFFNFPIILQYKNVGTFHGIPIPTKYSSSTIRWKILRCINSSIFDIYDGSASGCRKIRVHPKSKVPTFHRKRKLNVVDNVGIVKVENCLTFLHAFFFVTFFFFKYRKILLYSQPW